ncbi:DUF2147 domain-containing protein [Sphingopyxis sp. BSNA05]|uniref:DUF2147 domain-containing protein n=1 Tax=Sphingopyxis sp. BSNA05 TaxID=1236614 RepID=UPI001563C938|nr:DUF2147 domain-containing protein [Sphingopyxis sp. BSNA05]NRD89078.1 DUF2147 domain-containing protein [Sphingopyxis sp. BSNA05]
MCTFSCYFATPVQAETSAQDVYGDWELEGGKLKIRISDCGNNTPCGVTTWIAGDANNEIRDVHNPDPALRGRRLIGLQVLYGFRAEEGKWMYGQVYDPKIGETFRATLERQPNGVLKMEGCFGPFCKTEIWSKI